MAGCRVGLPRGVAVHGQGGPVHAGLHQQVARVLSRLARLVGLLGGVEHVLVGQQVTFDRDAEVAHALEDLHGSDVFDPVLETLAVDLEDVVTLL